MTTPTMWRGEICDLRYPLVAYGHSKAEVRHLLARAATITYGPDAPMYHQLFPTRDYPTVSAFLEGYGVRYEEVIAGRVMEDDDPIDLDRRREHALEKAGRSVG